MNRCFVIFVAGTVLLANVPLLSARSHRSASAADKSTASAPVSAADAASAAAASGASAAPAAASATGSAGATATLPAPPPAPAQPPSALPPPQYALPPPQYGQPPAQYGLPPPQYALPPPQYALPPTPPPQQPLIVPTRPRKYWELSAVGGIVIGGVYVLSVLAGSISYGGFYQGQWGFFVPLVGPALTLGNVGGQVCPCAASQLYAYGIGSVLTIAYVGALVPVILGGILTKNVPVQNTRVQLVPTITRDTYGFQLVSRF